MSMSAHSRRHSVNTQLPRGASGRERVLLVDYGDVVSEPQSSSAIEAMAERIGLSVAEFKDRYRRYRSNYDAGGDAFSYWSAVAGAEVRDAGALEKLVELDIASWSHINRQTLAVLAAASRRGWRLEMLSNAPAEVARAVEQMEPLRVFRTMLFSADLGAAKPDAGAYEAAVAKLGVGAHSILFVDDKDENVEAAIACGLHAHKFTSPEVLGQVLS